MGIAKLLLDNDNAGHIPFPGQTVNVRNSCPMGHIFDGAWRSLEVPVCNHIHKVIARLRCVPEISGTRAVVINNNRSANIFDHGEKFNIIIFTSQDHQTNSRVFLCLSAGQFILENVRYNLVDLNLVIHL